MQNQAGTGIKKRLACDRCHSRKLRCSGDLNGCSRCVGDNSVCTYSPALKVGRPSKASMSPRNPQQQETQSISETGFYEVDALSADSGISMPPSPPQLGDSCITALDHSALFDSFDFTSNLGNFNATHPFLDVTANQDWTVPTSPQPISSHEPVIDPRLQCHETTTPSPLERLPNLQQQLLRTRLPSRESGTPVKSVENAMKPVQETLGVVTDLLKQSVKKGSDSVSSDWQTVLHLVLTPLSLLLSTYDQILNEICNPKGCALSECRIAGLQLDPPLRVILLATVVDYQLKHLYHAVRLFQSKFMHSSSLGIADCMSSATMAEVQSTIRSLLSVTRNTLQQSQEI